MSWRLLVLVDALMTLVVICVLSFTVLRLVAGTCT